MGKTAKMNMDNKKINVYTCKKGHETVTIDREKGVTPASIDCPKGGCGYASSAMYRTDQTQEPTHEWVMLSEYAMRKLADHTVENMPQVWKDGMKNDCDDPVEAMYDHIKEGQDQSELTMREVRNYQNKEHRKELSAEWKAEMNKHDNWHLYYSVFWVLKMLWWEIFAGYRLAYFIVITTKGMAISFAWEDACNRDREYLIRVLAEFGWKY